LWDGGGQRLAVALSTLEKAGAGGKQAADAGRSAAHGSEFRKTAEHAGESIE
jgi:hypothetical protein